MFLPCSLAMRLVGYVACDSVTMDIPMRMMSSVAIVMAREKSGTSWELWRLLPTLIWEVRKRREEGREGRGKGGRREGREDRREGGQKGGRREGNDANWNEATFHKVSKSQDTSLLTSALYLQV